MTEKTNGLSLLSNSSRQLRITLVKNIKPPKYATSIHSITLAVQFKGCRSGGENRRTEKKRKA